MNKIDAAVGATTCTSLTRPAAPYEGQFIRETDTGKMYCCYADATPGPVQWRQVLVESTAGDIADFNTQISVYKSSGFTGAYSANQVADTDDRIRINSNGTIWWGPGDDSTDTALSRTAFGHMDLNGRLDLEGLESTLEPITSRMFNDVDPSFEAYRNGEPQRSWTMNARGKMEWGSGAVLQDTNLYRGAVGQLKTDGDLSLNGGSLEILDGRVQVDRYVDTDSVFSSGVDTDGQWRHFVRANGKHEWGDGTAALDTFLYREGAGDLKTDGHFTIGGTAFPKAVVVEPALAADDAISVKIPANANQRFKVVSDGKMWWGDGTAVLDTNLYRPSASVLQTDDAFVLGGNNGSDTDPIRFVGEKAATGAPTTGTWVVGDMLWNVADGVFYRCTVAGTPGTWVASGAGGTFGAWTAPTSYGAGIDGSNIAPYYTFAARTEPGSTVRLRGAFDTVVATSYTADATMLTLPSQFWPSSDVRWTGRSLGTGAANTAYRLTTAGVLSASNTYTLAAGQTAIFPMDGFTYSRA